MATITTQPTLQSPVLDAATARTRARYDRLARVYDRMENRVETRRFSFWRELLWSRVQGERVLEIGVGTGKNIAFHPPGSLVTAIDLSPKMLERASQEAARLGSPVTLQLADAQVLPFPDATFDAVVATFVFCSVPDPIRGLNEARRVLKPDGQLLLLEHVLSSNRLLRFLMRALNPLVVRVMGANVNRTTVYAVEQAGFRDTQVDDLMGDIVKLIQASDPTSKSSGATDIAPKN